MILARAARVVLGVSSLAAFGCSVPPLDSAYGGGPSDAATPDARGDATSPDSGGNDATSPDSAGNDATSRDAGAGDATGDAAVTIFLVQSNSNVYQGGASVSAFDCPLATPTAGDMVVAAVNFGPGVTPNVTDSQNNTYKPAVNFGQMAIFYLANFPGSDGGDGDDSGDDGGEAGSFQVTAGFSSPTTGLIMAFEYAGIAPNPRDQTNEDTGNDEGVSESSGPVTVTANELVFGFGRSDEGVVMTPSPGFRGLVYAGGAYAEDFIAPPPGSYAASFTPMGDSGTWTSLVASFHGN